MLPLEGVRVLSVEQYGAGPAGTMFLADIGADVIKIENRAEGGDMSRRVGPFFLGENDSHFFQSWNRNKRSLTLDLKTAEGQAVLHDLVRSADAVFHNLKGDKPAKLGLTYAQLAPFNPRIVCTHLTAYGRTGSRASWPGFDYLMQAEAGYLSLTGEPDGPPSRCGLSIIDLMTGLTAAFATTSAIIGARATGQGRDIDTSLFDLALSNVSYLATWYLNEGYVQGRVARSGHPSLVPSQLYRTRDGWIFIMCNKESFWPVLARSLGHPEWIDDPAFATAKARLENRDRITGMLDGILTTRTTAEWLEHFAGEVPAAPVHDVAAALDNPFVVDEGRLMSFDHPQRANFRTVRGPVQCPGETMPARPAPALGADTEEILAEAGYDAARIAALKADGII
ncbi:MAG: CoA transferase [Hyphomicrobiaceae bacterium]|nr:CoA transferase [Hyphomicrobiaceae bacterium]